METNLYPQCDKCGTRACFPAIEAGEKPSLEQAPTFCPMKLEAEVFERALSEYDKEEVREFARLASIQEFECYERTPQGLRTKIPRVEETVQFAHKNGYRRLGLAFCVGLGNEARTLVSILERKGFEVVSVCCKTGAIPKERIGVNPEEKIAGPHMYESMCNPITQAEILNKEKVDLALMLGLCVGHDTLFLKYCRVPVTVLGVKDRVFGHNPIAALYMANSYYSRLRAKSGK